MTDEELISQLRSIAAVITWQASDRIEQLVKEVEAARHEADAYAWLLEGKLAKAVEVLRFTDDGANHGVMTSTYGESALRYILRGIRERAREVLAELEKTE